MVSLNMLKANTAWILHREEIYTMQKECYNVYLLIDAYSGFCFGSSMAANLPADKEIIELLKLAYIKVNQWPEQLVMASNDPYVDRMKLISNRLAVNLSCLPAEEVEIYVQPAIEKFIEFSCVPAA